MEHVASKAQPLDEAWWEDLPREDFPPPDHVPILGPCERTRPGFELLSPEMDPSGHFRTVEGGYHEVCLWDLWGGDPDPAESSEVKQRINAMQLRLPPLDEETRLLRLQAASVVRCWWRFPANVDLVLGGIAAGSVNLEDGVSCEPPWTGMLETLRKRRGHPLWPKPFPTAWLHHQQGCSPSEDPRQELIRAYLTVLTWWLAGGAPYYLRQELPAHADLAETICRRLGPPTRLKQLQVERLHLSLLRWAIPRLVTDPGEAFSAELQEILGNLIRQEGGDRDDPLSRWVAANRDNGPCHHGFIRHLDHQIAAIGAGGPVTLPGAGDERRRVEGALTTYVHVLGSWLAGRTVEQTAAIWPPCAEEVGRLYDLLARPTPVKRWLAACLRERLMEVQAHAGRGPLDEEPERFALPARTLDG